MQSQPNKCKVVSNAEDPTYRRTARKEGNQQSGSKPIQTENAGGPEQAWARLWPDYRTFKEPVKKRLRLKMEKRLKCGEEKTRGKKKDRTGRQSSEPAQGKTVESSQQTYQQQAETENQLEDTSTNLQSYFQLPLRLLGNAHFYANTERNGETGRNKKPDRNRSLCSQGKLQWLHKRLQLTLVEMWCYRGCENRLRSWLNSKIRIVWKFFCWSHHQ